MPLLLPDQGIHAGVEHVLICAYACAVITLCLIFVVWHDRMRMFVTDFLLYKSRYYTCKVGPECIPEGILKISGYVTSPYSTTI